MSWVYPEVSFQMDIPETPPQEGVQRASTFSSQIFKSNCEPGSGGMLTLAQGCHINLWFLNMAWSLSQVSLCIVDVYWLWSGVMTSVCRVMRVFWGQQWDVRTVFEFPSGAWWVLVSVTKSRNLSEWTTFLNIFWNNPDLISPSCYCEDSVFCL